MRIEHWWYTAGLRLRSIVYRARVEQELDEELQFHLEKKIEEGIARGLSGKDARYAALPLAGAPQVDVRRGEVSLLAREHGQAPLQPAHAPGVARSLREAFSGASPSRERAKRCESHGALGGRPRWTRGFEYAPFSRPSQ